MSLTESFGQYLRRHRETARLSLRDLAVALDVSHTYLHQVEMGVRETLGTQYWVSLLKALPTMRYADLVYLRFIEPHGAVLPARALPIVRAFIDVVVDDVLDASMTTALLRILKGPKP